MFADQIAAGITGARRLDQLDQLARTIWGAYGSGIVPDDQAEALGAALEARRKVLRGLADQPAVKSQKPLWSGPSRFPPRRAQKAPDRRRSIERRRRLAASGPMPPALASRFTTGELAVLRIVGDEVAGKGTCSLTLGELSARAGCSRSTAKNALRSAARAGLLVIEERRQSGRKNLSNLIRITSAEWTTWLARGERRIGVKKFTPTVRGFRNKGRAASNCTTYGSANRVGERGGMRFRQSRRE